MQRTSGTLILAAVFVVTGTLASAADGRRTTGIGVFAGYSESKDAEKGTAHVGGVLELRFLELLGGRLEVGHRKEDVAVDSDNVSDAEIRYIPILFSAQLFPFGERLNPLSPFVMGGPGIYVTRFEADVRFDGDEQRVTGEDVELGWHVGAGSDFNLGRHLTLTGDVRWVFLDTDFKDIPESDADGVWVTAGIKFFFN